MEPDDLVCLCFRVSKRKIVNYCKREKPPHASMISDCLSAGTGCQWCVPFLRKLHAQCAAGVADPDLPVKPQEYAARRSRYRKTGVREGFEGEIESGEVDGEKNHRAGGEGI